MNTAVDLVLGTAFRYAFEPLRPFVDSLQATGFRGDLVLLHHHVAPSVQATLAARGVKLQTMSYLASGQSNRLSQLWPAVAPMVRRFRTTFAARQLLKAILPLPTTRFLHYRDFLLKHRKKYRNVLLTDIRDVFFQSDPLRDFPGGIEVYQETKSLALKHQVHNAHWINELFGADALAAIGDHPVICSGTIIGDVDSLLDFLTDFEALLCNVRRIDICGSDQGVHNYLCRVVIPPRVRVMENGAGRVLTLGTASLGQEFALRADGEVLGPGGSAVPIIHQYDRHPEVARRLSEKVFPAS